MLTPRALRRCLTLGAAILLAGGLAMAQGTFINWENPPVHPIDLSPDGSTLAVANLADGRVEFFDLSLGVPVASGAVQVGIDPTAVRFRNNTEVWAANFISDSVSVIDVATKTVAATLATLDAPQDVIFAGTPERAFVACSGVATLQVFDPATRTQSGTVAVNAFDVNALAKSADGSKVYVTVFHSGNGTTVLGGGQDDTNTLTFPANVVSDPLGPYGGVNPPPNDGAGFKPAKNAGNGTAPKVGLIVRKDASGQWMDDNGGNWTNFVSGPLAGNSGRPVGWDLPDRDLAIVDANTLAVGYATRLMNINMAVSVNPGNGKIYVVGTEATNEIRFEPNVNGTFVRVHLAIVNPNGTTDSIVDLNPHLDYSEEQVAQAERDKSIGDPRGIAWNADGTRGYVTGMGSNNVIVIDANGDRLEEIPTEVGEGPTGAAFDAARGRVYVVNRFAGSLSVLDAQGSGEIARVDYYDPSPVAIKTGRKHLYDTHKNSGLGQVACASCHVDGKMDKLGWDLGDPSGTLKSTAGQNNLYGAGGLVGGGNLDANWHPMKGPMTTQTFQDIIGKEPLHWRGDRFGLEEFNAAFIGLQGDDTNLDIPEMAEFENFVATIYFPPNPYRNFDNTLPTNLPLPNQFANGRFALDPGDPLPSGNAINGLNIYRNNSLDAGAINCVTCHTLPTGAGGNQTLNGFSLQPIPNGPNGEKHLALVAIDGSTQDAIKIPQTRNMREKSGMEFTPGNLENNSGFGFTHDGAVDSVARFVSEPIFQPTSDQQVADLVALMLAFGGSDLPLGNNQISSLNPLKVEPIGEPSKDSHAATGKQVVLTSNAVNATITTMIAEAEESGTGTTRGVDVIVKGLAGGVERGWVYDRATDSFRSDRDSDATVTPANLRNNAAPGTPQTYMVVPRGSGLRCGIDRDGDGYGDRTEIEACTDPANPNSNPGTGQSEINVTPTIGLAFGTQDIAAGPTATQDATIASLGPGPLHFKGAKLFIGGANASDFGVVGAVAKTAMPLATSRTVSIAFDPTGAGTRNATLYVISDDCDEGIVAVPLSGTGTNGATPTETASPTPTDTPTDTPTETQTPADTASPTPTPADTESPTATPVDTASPTATPVDTASPTATPVDTASPTPTATPGYDGRAFGDFDNSGCTDIQDFLFLLDYWQEPSPIGGGNIVIQDFLALLDYWQTGVNCP